MKNQKQLRNLRRQNRRLNSILQAHDNRLAAAVAGSMNREALSAQKHREAILCSVDALSRHKLSVSSLLSHALDDANPWHPNRYNRLRRCITQIIHQI